jgi:tRNA A-37 threonylcarbamoyl transferase component Bud32
VLPAGTEVGGYRVIGKIGEGGMATVYEAEQVSLDRVVALKVLARELADDEVFHQRFERERKVQAELDHPHVVTVFEGGPSVHGQWLAMQLVEGRTLAKILESEGLAPETVWNLLTPIADALEAAHEKGLIHRDVTPTNILVADDGTPFLADFGLAKRPEESSLTESGQVVGTLKYVAPERINGEAVPASDVYSLALVLYRCLCGRLPFATGDRNALLLAHLFESPPAPTVLDGSLPPALDAVIAKGLAKEPAERYQRPSELIAAARASFEGGALEDVAPPIPLRTGRARTPRRSPRLLGGAALLLFALGLGAGAFADGSPRQEERLVRAGPLQVAVPEGWVTEKSVVTRFPDLHLADSSTLVPRGGKGTEAATVGISLARGKTLLPPALRPYASHPRGVPLSLGSLQALRYDGLGSKPRSEPWTVIVAPTSVGVATIACRAGPRGGDLRRTCQRLAASLKLLEGAGYPIGSSSQLATLLRRQIGTLNREVRHLRRRLQRASGSGAQAAVAAGLADVFRRRARTLAAFQVSPQSAAHLAGLVSGLRLVRDAYKRLAAAARSGNRRAYRTGVDEIYLVESILYNRILYLRSLGYRVVPVR